ncbi:hypothetical protein V2S66_18385 [Streptomyces sp. V4-01]|uniref:Uncharacterized protein n=1 Tax=Actinacidiphila polyblastidii TaxID=3110430 RepID=A0ABU7PF71_9ACTN|nr:hypothetical protein [Streptomyces sp. V4-01]
MSDRHAVPDAVPHFDQPGASQWGQMPQPVQQPTDTPRGSKAGMLTALGVVVLVALVLLTVALVRS